MPYELFDLTDRTALITGAGGLLGQEHAAALLEAGASVVLTDIGEAALQESLEALRRQYGVRRLHSSVMDVTDPGGITRVQQDLVRAGIHVDILVNNAAIDPKVAGGSDVLESSRLENFSLSSWNLQLAVGLTGSFLCSQTFGTAMARSGRGGVILNIASDLAIISPDQRLYRKDGVAENLQPVKPVTYSVIKAGLVGMTRYLSTYWVEQGVRCNALSPGGVANGQPVEFVARLSRLIPLGRMARGSEYRSAVQFLCSDASSYMNGQNLVMDGGRSIW